MSQGILGIFNYLFPDDMKFDDLWPVRRLVKVTFDRIENVLLQLTDTIGLRDNALIYGLRHKAALYVFLDHKNHLSHITSKYNSSAFYSCIIVINVAFTAPISPRHRRFYSHIDFIIS